MKSTCAIIVNPTSCRGKGIYRWNQLKDVLPFVDAPVFLTTPFDPHVLEHQLQKWLHQGIRKFLIVGGDGSCTATINGLIRASATLQVPSSEIICGAIGTGSTNDFHKPFSNRIITFPCRINFETPILSDLCWWETQAGPRTYFLLNAIVGISAEAHEHFNTNLRILKKISTKLSTLWAALHTFLTYENRSLTLSLYGTRQVANLGIVRSPYFSGDFSYPVGEAANSGHFGIYLCDNLSKLETLRIFGDFLKGRFSGTKLYQCRGTTFSVQSDSSFCIECDGEIFRQTQLTFGIDRSRIQLCT